MYGRILLALMSIGACASIACTQQAPVVEETVTIEPSPEPTESQPEVVSTDTKDLDEALVQAVVAGDVARTEQLLVDGADPNAEDADGNPALKTAILGRHRSLQLLDALIGYGADVNALDADRNDLLAVAVEAGELEVVERLLAAGADVDGVVVTSNIYMDASYALNVPALSVAVFASNDEMVDLLIASGADVNKAESYNQFTPLHIAAFNADTQLVEKLLDAGADFNRHCSTNYGETALHVAARRGVLSPAELLLAAGAPIDAQTDVGVTPLMTVMTASYAGALRSDMVRFLLDHGADPNLQDGTIGHASLHYAARNDQYRLIPLLIANGAEIEMQNQAGDTALHVAAKWDQANAVAALLVHGARIDIVNEKGETPLDLAQDAEVIDMLETNAASQGP